MGEERLDEEVDRVVENEKMRRGTRMMMCVTVGGDV